MSIVGLARVVSVEPVVGRAGRDVQINALLRCVPVVGVEIIVRLTLGLSISVGGNRRNDIHRLNGEWL